MSLEYQILQLRSQLQIVENAVRKNTAFIEQLHKDQKTMALNVAYANEDTYSVIDDYRRKTSQLPD